MNEEVLTCAVEQDISKLAVALCKVQGKLTNPPKNKTVNTGKYSYSYADLGSIIDHTRSALAEHGMSVVQTIQIRDSGNCLVTMLIHESGQSITSIHPLPKGCAAQEFGSYLTYARRYSLCSILGVAAEDDDDGQQANMAPKESTKEAKARDQLIELMGHDSIGNGALLKYCKANGLAKDGDRIAGDLSLDAVDTLVQSWPEVVKAIKQAAKKSKPAGKQTPVPSVKPKDEVATPDDTLVNPDLLKQLKNDGLTLDLFKRCYVTAGHFPDDMEPCDLPDDYIANVLAPQNWKKLKLKAEQLRKDG